MLLCTRKPSSHFIALAAEIVTCILVDARHASDFFNFVGVRVLDNA
jgi:hypothetical protein